MRFFIKCGLIDCEDDTLILDEENTKLGLEILEMRKKKKAKIYREYYVFFCQSCGIWACQLTRFQECNTCLFVKNCTVKKGDTDAKILYEECPSCRTIFDI